jgi:hypothetical protein
MSLNKVDLLAAEFSKRLASDVGDYLKELIERNRKETIGLICHSHDFCDANVTMAESFFVVIGREIDLDSGADLDLVNAAWQKAKRQEFACETQ